MHTSSLRRIFIAAPITASLLLATGTAYAQFFQNFDTIPNNGSPVTFANDSGGWSVSNPTGISGVYQSDAAKIVNFSTIVSPNYINLTDATLTFDVLNSDDSGAVLRSDANAANAVALIVRPAHNDLYFIQRVDNSFVDTYFGAVSLAGVVTPGENLRVTFSSAGELFTASVASLDAPNTILQSTSYTFAANSVPASGRAGLYQYGNAAFASQFDNVGLTNNAPASAAPEPGALPLLGTGFLGSAVTIRGTRRRRTAKLVR